MWRFCGGWNPERVPLAVEYYRVEDVELLLGQLIELHEAISAHQAAQAKAKK